MKFRHRWADARDRTRASLRDAAFAGVGAAGGAGLFIVVLGRDAMARGWRLFWVSVVSAAVGFIARFGWNFLMARVYVTDDENDRLVSQIDELQGEVGRLRTRRDEIDRERVAGWREQEKRFRALDQSVEAMWSRGEDGVLHWCGVQDREHDITRREVLRLEAEAVAAGRMLGGKPGDHAEMLSRWMDTAVALVGSDRGIEFVDEDGQVGAGTVAQAAELSAVACALLASGRRP